MRACWNISFQNHKQSNYFSLPVLIWHPPPFWEGLTLDFFSVGICSFSCKGISEVWGAVCLPVHPTQKCLVGLNWGLCAGQSSSFILTLVNNVFMDLKLCAQGFCWDLTWWREIFKAAAYKAYAFNFEARIWGRTPYKSDGQVAMYF